MEKPTSVDNIVPFQPRHGSEMDAVETQQAAERAAIMDTLGNVMTLQESFDHQMKLATAIIAELQAHVRDLEHEVANLKKSLPKKPAILNAQGARAN